MMGVSFHARQDTLTPMRAGLVRVGSNTLLCAALAPFLGHRGVALATTVSLYVKLLVLGFSLRDVFAPHDRRRHLRVLGRVMLAVGVMFTTVFPFAAFASTPEVLERWSGPPVAGLAVPCLSVYAAALGVPPRRPFLLRVGCVRHPVLGR